MSVLIEIEKKNYKKFKFKCVNSCTTKHEPLKKMLF